MAIDAFAPAAARGHRPVAGTEAEWAAQPLHPVARWRTETDEQGRDRLTCVWEVPEPVLPA